QEIVVQQKAREIEERQEKIYEKEQGNKRVFEEEEEISKDVMQKENLDAWKETKKEIIFNRFEQKEREW
ncbi:607_t:CDS:1, partial [Cetraspora pellucida]